MAIYGFIAAVLPVWVLLVPRDYLSSFLKIGTIALLVIGVIIANPKMQRRRSTTYSSTAGQPYQARFSRSCSSPSCAARSADFTRWSAAAPHPKMLEKETDARVIGYGAMLMEGLVGVVAMIAAALSLGDYYAMNTDLPNIPAYHEGRYAGPRRKRSNTWATTKDDAGISARPHRRRGDAGSRHGCRLRQNQREAEPTGFGNTGITLPSCSRRCSS
jgi:carbon starvation protein CstA